jgi:hypothetical protein
LTTTTISIADVDSDDDVHSGGRDDVDLHGDDGDEYVDDDDVADADNDESDQDDDELD